MTRVTVENVTRRFWLDDDRTRHINAVDQVTFKVSEGGRVAIIGPSGCGKTTLLRLIAGLDKPDAGRILYNDEPLDSVPRDERHIGMIFQNFALMPHWDSGQTIGFFLRLRNRQQEIPARVERVSKITGVGMEQLMQRYPRQLSGGEKQRVAIARAFTRDLNLLLLDEPFANLDAKLRTEARLEVNRLLSEFPVTTILSTHDQQEAASLSDLILLMRAGQVEQVGSYQALYENPATAFVAEFIGLPTMNLFAGHAESGQWRGAFFGGFALPQAVPDGQSVTLGIRPGDIEPVTDDNAHISAEVDRVTPYFAERYTELQVSHRSLTWTLTTEPEQSFRPGQVIHCRFDPDALYFFDGDSGQRLQSELFF
jgi:ABC-type sugar transport system ATPase subunit